MFRDTVVRVWFDGTDLEPLEVQDVSHARPNCNVRIIVACVLLSFVILVLLGDSNEMSVVSSPCFFFVVCPGDDVVLVYSNLWRASAKIHENRFDFLTSSYKSARKGFLATTITALSFSLRWSGGVFDILVSMWDLVSLLLGSCCLQCDGTLRSQQFSMMACSSVLPLVCEVAHCSQHVLVERGFHVGLVGCCRHRLV